MYVVVGANGYLGSYIVKNIIENTKSTVVATARRLERVFHMGRVKWVYCDVTEENSVKCLSDIINKADEPVNLIYLSAYHHPDEVEKNRLTAWNVNVTCLSRFLENVCGDVQRFIYASTDSVYGESINHYHFKETDKLNPVNFYGHCKCAAEALVIHNGFSVVRFPFLISPSLVYKPHFYDQIVETLKSGSDIEMYIDSYRSSLSFDNAAYLLMLLLERAIDFDIINICGDNDLSKFDVGCLIAKKENISIDNIIPVSILKRNLNFVTRRAGSTLMSNEVLKKVTGIKKIDIFEKPQ